MTELSSHRCVDAASVPGGRVLWPRRILFIDHIAKMGGGEIALLNLVRYLDASRFQPAVLLFSDGPLAGQLREAGIETFILPLAPEVLDARKDAIGGSSLLKLKALGLMLKHTWRVSRFIRLGPFELVHTNSLKSDIVGGIAARLARVPVIWHVRDRIHPEYLPRRVADVFRFLSRVIPTAIITNSQATMDTLRTPGNPPGIIRRHLPGNRPGRNTVVHDGTLVPQESPPIAPNPIASPRIGILGRITRWKGQDVFLKAAARIRQRFPTARFLIVGSAMFGEQDFEASLHQLTDSLGLRDAVTFEGFRADVEAVLASWDVLVHASTVGEPFGQVIIEAMALGKPVVAARGGGVPEIVEDGINGILTAPGDEAALAEAVCRLLDDPASALRIGTAGRERVISKFTIQHVARGVERVYTGLLGD